MDTLLFPYDQMRDVQKELVEIVQKCIETKTPLVVHAPTGLGKTAATLAPAVTIAKERDLIVFFLTSRHTQHIIGIQTLKEMKKKFNVGIPTVSMVGKKHLCAQGGVTTMRSDDFLSYCKALREDNKCSFYQKARDDKGPTKEAEMVANQLITELPAPSEHVLQRGIETEICPYELSLMLSQNAKVIIGDYNYLFNERIREPFLAKIGKKLEQCIVVIDEGHNLPGRLREQMTQRLNTTMIRRAIKEAEKYNYPEVKDILVGLKDILEKFSKGLFRDQEKLITRDMFVDEVKRIKDYEEIVSLLEWAGDGIREDQKTSSVGTISTFLEGWDQGDEGFSRILSVKSFRNEQTILLSHRCLDPSIAAKPVIEGARCTIIMSGTLTPTNMYADILGFPKKTLQKELPSPFPVANKISLIVPGATTRYSQRNEGQYRRISDICVNVTDNVPGCSAIFFPSYALRDDVAKHFNTACKKTVFMEDSSATKEERQDLLKRFATYKDTGAVLLGVAAGSFGEGIDLPGILKSVIVVGIPLDRPDLETKELITYYDRKFGKGWEYGYVLPAITKTLQNAGRCIRSETDRGVLVFVDERYSQPMYSRCFPKDWNPKLASNPVPYIKHFFS